MQVNKVLKNKALSDELVPTFSADALALDGIAPAGWLFVHRYTWAGPIHMVNRYPEKWAQTYQNNHYVAGDPVFAWICIASLSKRPRQKRWSEMKTIGDPRRIVEKAKAFGLNYGAAFTHKLPTLDELTFLSVARSDRELEPQEMTTAMRILKRWGTDIELDSSRLTDDEIETLSLLNNGLKQNEVALALGVSRSAIKLRVSNAMRKLHVKSSTAAVGEAVSRKLI